MRARKTACCLKQSLRITQTTRYKLQSKKPCPIYRSGQCNALRQSPRKPKTLVIISIANQQNGLMPQNRSAIERPPHQTTPKTAALHSGIDRQRAKHECIALATDSGGPQPYSTNDLTAIITHECQATGRQAAFAQAFTGLFKPVFSKHAVKQAFARFIITGTFITDLDHFHTPSCSARHKPQPQGSLVNTGLLAKIQNF